MLTLRRPLILASNSPRRQQLMKEAGFEFRVEVRSTEEDFPLDMPPAEVAEYLARHKAEQFSRDLGEELVLCADTIVVVDSTILNKPADAAEAGTMLRMLSGRTHQVITGLCLLSGEGSQVVSDVAHVTFRELVQMEIDYYIQQYRPFDKAGAYGIQEWIGMVGIERIEGSYYTIMGLPVHKVYQLLKSYVR
ncbi:Maf family protein [Telluribacter sp.]|uniref:Maf family protein n=1 Tax=Telluribacter sp. TaxID=1978767 RepID=UPI002E12BE53|nr:Maf family nucleotide pyrophosphatase [Telluribacter sp.]